MEPKFIPSIGRDVHFLADNGSGGVTSQAAKIVSVCNPESGACNLVVWNAGGTMTTATSVLPGDGPGRWMVRPRVGG